MIMITNSLKRFFKKLFLLIGIDARRANSSVDGGMQIVSALHQVNASIIFDVGANSGQFAKDIRKCGFAGQIISFEPLSSARKQLTTFQVRDPLWILHDQCAIGDFVGDIQINIAGNSVSSSVLPMLRSHSDVAVGSAYVSTELVPINTLDQVAAKYLKPDSKLFVKIDTQGFEWQVLDGAVEVLELAQGVICELSLVPLYEGQRLWRDIIDRLDQEGFMLWALQRGFTDPRTGQTLQMDGIFLRRDAVND